MPEVVTASVASAAVEVSPGVELTLTTVLTLGSILGTATVRSEVTRATLEEISPIYLLLVRPIGDNATAMGATQERALKIWDT